MIECLFFEKISRKKFFDRYWRKRPLLIKGGVRGLDKLLSRTDIWRLAGDSKVTSRMVTNLSGARDWTMDFGPFTRNQLKSLPAKKWTILVQEVDHQLEELSLLRRHFEITPQWLFDDVMVSYAADQGSVGPHIDQYDVFLVQGFGQRRWQISDRCQNAPELIDGLPIKIMKKFVPTMEWLCEPGDVLYLPPMVPHFGVAVGECSTYSVGFRSFTQREIIQSFIERVSETMFDSTIELRSRINEAGSAKVGNSVLKSMHNELKSKLLNSTLMKETIGSVMTAIRRGDETNDEAVPQKLGRSQKFSISPSARIAYFYEDDSEIRFYANGASVAVPKKIQRHVVKLFDERQIDLEKIKVSKEQSRLLRGCILEMLISGVVRQRS